MNNIKEEKLHKNCARLESQVDLLETEILTMNQLLLDIGFPEGMSSLKKAAKELLSGQYDFKNGFLKSY